MPKNKKQEMRYIYFYIHSFVCHNLQWRQAMTKQLRFKGLAQTLKSDSMMVHCHSHDTGDRRGILDHLV